MKIDTFYGMRAKGSKRERRETCMGLQIKVSGRPVVFRHSSRVLLIEWPVAN